MMLRLRSAQALGSFPRARHGGLCLYGQDGGQSVDLRDGRVLFLFSDTLLVEATRAPETPYGHGPPVKLGEQRFLGNTAAIAPVAPYRDALRSMKYLLDEAGIPRELIVPEERERFLRHRFWPEHGVRLGSAVYFYYLGVEITDATSIWGFRSIGAGLARMDLETLAATRLSVAGDWRYFRSVGDDMHFGVCVHELDGFVYAYYTIRNGIRVDGYLARVESERIEEPNAYEFLASHEPAWTKSREQAVSLAETAPEFTVTFNRHLGKYLMLYVNAFDKTVNVRTANALWGPFTPEEALIRVPSDPASPIVYLGFEHSAFEADSGRRIFVSYSQPAFALNASVALTFA